MKPLPNNLAQWLQFIDSGHSAEIDLGLSRVRPVAERLGLLAPWPWPIITVAGTNGKGSTVALMRAIANAHGLRVGCYTSPHFIAYNERVSIAGVDASDTQLCAAFTAVERARGPVGVTLTYFEYGTLAALWLFRQQPLDLLLLEVGLGGRLDAVNLIDADVAVVTTVALDHESWLGRDRDSIGREKAGICRGGKPLVYGEADLPQSVAQVSEAVGAILYRWGDEFTPEITPSDWRWQGRDGRGVTVVFEALPEPQLPLANAATAIQALLLANVTLQDGPLRSGLAHARLTGRMQRISVAGRPVILDVAHNPHAAAYLAAQLGARCRQRWCVVGMLGDKDIAGTLHALAPAVDHWLPVSLTLPRGASAQQLQALLPEPPETTYATVAEALTAALALSQADDEILVVGSFYTVADALKSLAEHLDGVA